MSFSVWLKTLEGTLESEPKGGLRWPTKKLTLISRDGIKNFLRCQKRVMSVFLFADTPQGHRYWRDRGHDRLVHELTEDELEWFIACLIEHHGYTEEQIHELRLMG